MATQPPEITAIEVEGFKSLHTRQRLELKPLTIIAGANSSGKSSLMQPLLLLKQTLESPFSPSSLVLNGDHVKFTDPQQFLSQCAPVVQGFSIGMLMRENHCIVAPYAWDRSSGLIFEPSLTDGSSTVERRPFNILSVLGGRFISPEAYGALAGHEDEVALVRQLQSLLHLPGLRGNPERAYSANAVTEAPFKGPFPPYVASFILKWQESGGQEILQLNDWLTRLDLASRIKARKLDVTRIELLVNRVPDAPTENDLVSIADVGVGLSQTLPLLVALLAAPPGSWVYVEQPETHLHPKAQAALAGILAEGSRRGIKVIAETHSAILIRELQTLVASGQLACENVALHWCVRDRKTGATTVTPAELDEYGRYGEWPVDFTETSLETEERYLEAVSRRRRG